MTDPAKRSWFPGLLALIGGAAIVAGSLLTWLEVGGGVSVGSVSVTGTPTGSELLLGQVALGAGVAVVVLGLLLLVLLRARRLLGFLVILGGLVAIAAGAFVASSPQDRYIDFAVEKGAPAGQADEVRASLTNLFEVSSQETDLGIGLYIAIGGGALSVIGGLTAVFARRKPKPVEEAGEEAEEPSEPKADTLPEEWLAARALEAEAREAPAKEPPPQELVMEPVGPPLPEPPPQSDDAAPADVLPLEGTAEGSPEGLSARAEEATVVEEPSHQVLVTQAAPPPLPDPPPEPEEAAPWRSSLAEAAESPPEEEPVAIETPSDAAEEPAPAPEEPAPAPEPVTQTVAPPEPAEEPAKPDDRAAWSKPLPDDWVAKPAKRRRRRRS